MTGDSEYFEYLKSRRFGSWLYRQTWLYPRLCFHLRGRVLDVGCGIGDFLAFRKSTIGVDINPLLVDWCRQRGLPASLMAPDVLPFGDQEFDGVVLDTVLEHLDDPVPLLGEVHRVLRPGGTFIVGVPGEKGYALDADHRRYYSKADLNACLASAGFATRTILHMPLRSGWLSRRMRQCCLYGIFTRATR